MDSSLANERIIYHIYPLGMLGALRRNDYTSRPASLLTKINEWIPYLKSLNVSGLLLGPLFESEYHGYETVDYNNVDRRLGINENLKELVSNLHSNNIRVILDGVFNHCGRDFWAFRDLLINKNRSSYKNWFHGIDFGHNNRYNDGFSYSCWNNHLGLVKFNLTDDDLRNYLFNAVKQWIEYFDIDGLRLDAVDCINIEYLMKFSRHCKNLKKDFWLMGEIIHGNYNKWVNSSMLDSVTNYEIYKGLYSSHNDNNYFEIAYSLKRQYGDYGIYKNLRLYNFVDNHDVERIASILNNKSHLYPLYILLFTIPGIPSIYYGSEAGIEGKKAKHSDYALRPAVNVGDIPAIGKHPDLIKTIQKLCIIRNDMALCNGNYTELLVLHNQFAFKRMYNRHTVVVAVNSGSSCFDMELSGISEGTMAVDKLNNDETFRIINGKLKIRLSPYWGRIMVVT